MHILLHILAVNTSLDLSGLPHPGTAGNSDIQNILAIITTVLGAIAVLFIVIGGLRYIMSQGDPQAVGKAKGTIIYALIGLVVAISARAIVAFTLGGL
jgi:hypothetical protein